RTCSMIAASYDECSTATRMRLYTSRHPGAQRLNEKPDVERGDDDGDEIRERLQPQRVDESAHLRSVGGESHQRKDGEGKLQAQHDLAEDEKLRGSARAIEDGRHCRRHNGDEARDQSAQPG